MNSVEFLSWLDNQSNPKIKTFEKPLVMGIANVTPDSFSDGGRYFDLEKAFSHAQKLIEQGADILDIGGESSRPGAQPVSLDKELDRVIPLIQRLSHYSDICLSIDTYKPEVMHEAIKAGAHMINDICALQSEASLMMAKKLAVPVCMMHMQGIPQTMQNNPQYHTGVVDHLRLFFQDRVQACQNVGIPVKRLILDPGFGFGKQDKDNLHIVRELHHFKEWQCPVLLGVSRKSTIGRLLNKEVHERLAGSLALEVYAALQGVGILRTHEVEKTQNALTMLDAMAE